MKTRNQIQEELKLRKNSQADEKGVAWTAGYVAALEWTLLSKFKEKPTSYQRL